MKILLVAEYVRRYHWMPGAWVPAFARGLAARGHEVTVALDGTEDPELFLGTRLIVRRLRRTMRGSTPLAFQRWAMALVRSPDFDTTISFTTIVPARVWAPVGGSFIGSFIAMTRSHAGISAVLETLARPWLPAAAIAERRAESIAAEMRSINCRIGAVTDSAGAHPLGFASIAEHWPLCSEAPKAEDMNQVRRAARRALGIGDDRSVVVLSAVHPHRPGLGSFLGALELLQSELKERSPLALVLGRKPYTVERLARKHGGLSALRFLGPTAQIPMVFAAADVSVSPWSRARGSTTGRFIADALRFGRPVVAHQNSPGAALIDPAHFGTPEIGTLVEEDSAQAWHRALAATIASPSLGQTTRAARDVSRSLSLDGMCLRLEPILAGAR